MKTLIGILFVAAFAAGCTSVGLNGGLGTMDYTSAASSASPTEAADAYDRISRTNLMKRHADTDHEADIEIRKARAVAEIRVVEAQAQILESYANRMDPDKSQRVSELIEFRKELINEYINCDDPVRRDAIEKASKGTRGIIDSILPAYGTAGFGGMSSMPLMGAGLGGPMSFGTTVSGDDPGVGVITNQSNFVAVVSVNGGQPIRLEPGMDSPPVFSPPGIPARVEAVAFTTSGVQLPKTIGINVPIDFKPGNGWKGSGWSRILDNYDFGG